ncbi:MAG TPA: MarR family transcriptional regulator [Trebonia sp.]|jgi:DNA-binding MarR family transcriptional regulator|nr:MarR family transcriptional regulator [Trebonia sp.]
MTAERHRLLPGLVDEVLRLQGRLLALNTDQGAAENLTGAQLLVLTAVVNSERPPTVPQIGRSLGHARQSVQRIADALIARGLLASKQNPDHKRAPLLTPTEAGRGAHSRVHERSQAWITRVTAGIEPDSIANATETLRTLRVQMEAVLAAGRPAEQ